MGKQHFTVVRLDDQEYSIHKFDAMTGLQIARLILAKAAPLLPMLTGEGADKSEDHLYEAIAEIVASLTDEDIVSLASKCLRVCSVNLPAGQQPIMDERGNYGIPDIEYDLSLVLRLCIEAIKWGASDFFGAISSPLMARAT